MSPSKTSDMQRYHDLTEKPDSEDVSDESVTSENEGLLDIRRSPSYRLRGARAWLRDPCVMFIVGGLMFSILMALGITTLALIQTHAVTSRHGSHPMTHSPPSHKETGPKQIFRNEKGLRTTANGDLLECGATAKEAVENGCAFDAFAFSYIPDGCFEKDLMEEALSPDSYLAPAAAGAFPWYMWSNFTEPIPQTAEALSQHKSLWTNNAWHKAHCLYEWRLITRALHRQATGVRPVYVLKRALEVAHVRHCNQMVSDPYTEDSSPIWAMRSVGRCIRIDENEDDWEEPELHY